MLAKPIISFFLMALGVTNIQLAQDRSMNQVRMFVKDAHELDSTLSYTSTYSYALLEGSDLQVYSESEMSQIEKVIIEAKIFETGSVDESKVNIHIKSNGKWYNSFKSDDFKFEIEKYDLDKREIIGHFEFEATNPDLEILSLSKGVFKARF